MENMNRAVFLDRDGTLIVDVGYAHRIEDLSFFDGVIDGLLALQSMGFLLIIATNQSGIARGLFTERDYDSFTEAMLGQLANAGVNITSVYHCPHLEGCTCRKPAIGMFEQATADWDIDLASSYAIGDKLRDVSLCDKHTTTGIIISEESITSFPEDNGERKGRLFVADSFVQAVKLVEELEGSTKHESRR